ncbi:MAG: TraB/GumN family protein [Chitinophaga sp.]|uniref:TraB/GumN family protein n=1 Tax=Chitinophaga sp. TaxID=1869181 RepID=UPI001B0DBBD6|nr:TraB/GumN family protein [Chitinophaga sp.]MBO9727996.1 TraB/GumN family protein [Chitinophaga sp.]
MKKTLRNIVSVVILACLSVSSAEAQTSSLENSLLWEVSGNGLKQPSYLYGTIHMICENDFKITDKVTKAFNSSAALVLEADVFNPALVSQIRTEMASDVPLSKKLATADYAAVDSVLQLKCGMPLKTFDNFKLSMVMSLVAVKTFPCATPKSYEMALNKMATERNMHRDYMEDVIAQMRLLNKAYTDSQIVAQVKDFDSAVAGSVKLANLYKAEDINGLYTLMTSPELMDENTMKYMLLVRNSAWAEKMPGMMQKESCFFAVGAGHLPGPGGVIALLKAKGYTVKPVMN